MSEKRKIVVNTLANGVAQFAGVLSALVFMPFLVRGFGTTDYGLYLLASSVVGYAGLLDFGVGTSLVKLAAAAAAQDDRERLGRLTSSTLAFYTTIGVLIAALMVGLAMNTNVLFRVDTDGARLLGNLFFVAAGASLLAWPANTGAAVLGGFQRYTRTAAVSLATTFGTIGVTALVVLFHEGPVTLMIGAAMVNLAGGLANALSARSVLRGVSVSLFRADWASLRAIFSFSWAIFVTQLTGIILYQQTDRLVIGVFMGAAAIALYEAAGKFQALMSQLTGFAISALLPVVSRLDAEGRQEALKSLFLRGTKYTLALLSPVVVVLIVVAGPLLLTWLGPEFLVVTLSAQILISHQLLTGGAAVGDTIMIGLGKLPKRLPYIVGLAAMNLALSLALVRSYGIMGVVLGTAIPYFIDYPLHMRLILKTLDVPASRWLKETVLPIYPLLVVPLGASALLIATPMASSLLGIAAAGAISVGLYWVAVFVWGFNAAERTEVMALAERVVWPVVDAAAPLTAAARRRSIRRATRPGGAPGDPPLASIVLLTYNRISMLRLCLARVLETTHDVNCEIIVWDNASSDGTAAYLDETAANDPRLRVVHSLENVGLNGVARGVALARGAYIVEMDDDIIDMPEGWLSGMIHAFDTVPRAGFLAANVVDDEITNGAKPPADQYRAQAHGDVVIEYGPTGGWCAMTSRAVIDRIGNFIEQPDKVFFLEDGEFGQRCRRAFLRVGIVRDVVVYHAAGPLANAKFGCLDVCEEKYSRDPDLKPWLDATRELKARQSDG